MTTAPVTDAAPLLPARRKHSQSSGAQSLFSGVHGIVTISF